MKKSHSQERSLSQQLIEKRGAALLIVLSTLTILSALVLAFVASMNVESSSSHTIETAYRTKMVAHGALSHAIELLRSNIPDPAPITQTPGAAPYRNWATNPGRLTLITATGSRSHIPLHSGEAPDPDEDVVFDARSTDLNRPLAGRSRAPIANAAEDDRRPEMRVAWIPVLEDPSKAPGPDNKMKARYAFWIDDESSKLNTSVALGKPNPDDLDADLAGNWKMQLDEGWVTPRFSIERSENGDEEGGNTSDEPLKIALGHPWSINFDTLFEDGELPIDLWALHHEQRVHGFQRYPDAILRFIDLPSDEKRDWYNRNLWNVTFYSRSPEFNVFGFSRLFTLRRPTPLPTGPAYQAPFSQGGNSFFQALYGFPLHAGALPLDSEERFFYNDLTLASVKLLGRYLHLKWPGQDQSFADAYGEREAMQMALNMVMMTRFATADIQSPDDYANCISSMNQVGPDDDETQVPERFYWRLNERFEQDANRPPMLPQTPGPHINEIKFVVKPIERIDSESGDRLFELRYHYEVEYYLHPESPFDLGVTNPGGGNLQLPFRAKVDYMKLEAGDREQEFDQPNWNSDNLTKLHCETLPRGRTPELSDPYQKVVSTDYYFSESENGIEEGGKVLFDPEQDPEVTFKVYLRVGLDCGTAGVKQMVPLGTLPEDSLEGEFTIDLSFPDEEYVVSWEVKDPRVSSHKDDWELAEPGEDSMEEPNSNQPEDPDSPEYQSIKYLRLLSVSSVGSGEESGDSRSDSGATETPQSSGQGLPYGNEFSGHFRFSSIGYLSMLHAGIQDPDREPWKTLSLSSKPGEFPDWVLMDLFGATYPLRRPNELPGRSLPDHWMGMSYMNSTAGKVNLNNKVYPGNEWFEAPDRTQPLKAVFRYLRDDSEIESFVENILDWQNGGRAFEYVGQLSEVKGYAEGASTWEQEMLLRNMANCLTTQSNTFGVWGVAQTVTKSPQSELYDQFEENDKVAAEKRFYALIERYIWPGRDGVPGNGHCNHLRKWDRLADPTPGERIALPGDLPVLGAGGEFAVVDGPDSVGMDHVDLFADVPYEESSLAEADNPPHPLVKYRVIYFKYLDH